MEVFEVFCFFGFKIFYKFGRKGFYFCVFFKELTMCNMIFFRDYVFLKGVFGEGYVLSDGGYCRVVF